VFALISGTSEAAPTFLSQSRPNYAMRYSSYLRRCSYGVIFRKAASCAPGAIRHGGAYCDLGDFRGRKNTSVCPEYQEIGVV